MNKLIIITAPSGAGKSTIAKYLMDKNPGLAFSISATTRPLRGNEKHGRDYYFMSVDEFQHTIQQDGFVEWEMVYEGKYYGTLKSEIERIWQDNKTPMLDIDVKGAIHVKQLYSKNALTIFIEPPSIDELKKRLVGRNTDTPENIETRINKASYELSFKESFDRIIVNDNLKDACEKAEKAILAFIQQA